MKNILERGVLNEERIINDPDLVNRMTMNIGPYNPGVTTKYAVQLGLYAKSIKNLGSKIHHEALRKGALFQEMG